MAQISKHMLQQMKEEHEQIKALDVKKLSKEEIKDTLVKVTVMLVAVGTELSK